MIGRDSFVVDLVFKLCLSDSEICTIEIPVFSKQEIPKPLCSDVFGFKIPGIFGVFSNASYHTKLNKVTKIL